MEAKVTTKNLKNKITLSEKEKNLLILLFIVVLFWVFYRFVFTKQSVRLEELSQEKASYNDELLKIDAILAKEEAIDKEWEELNENVSSIQDKYFPTIDQPEIMYMLNGIVDKNSLKVLGMYFNEPDYAMLGGIETKYLGISIPFEGSYSELESFLSDISSLPKRFLVNQLAISKGDDGYLSGQIGLSAYSYGEIVDSTKDSTYSAGVQKVIKEDPFEPYEGYSTESEDKGSNDFEGDYELFEETENRVVLEDFEGENIYFMPTSSDITGRVTKFKVAKHGKYSLRTEYSIFTESSKERAYVVLDDNNIYLNYPPSSIGVWAFSYEYSPVTLGLRFRDQEGKTIDLELSEGINWTGWNFVEATPPQDVKLYPLKLDRIYLELHTNRNDYGVLLFDNIETAYPITNTEVEEKLDKKYSFYLVQEGDTLMSISEKIYGTESQYKLIMDLNGLNKDSIIKVGQVLVIP